jgi:DNA (cytosine-5)-methyltransferase 1
MTMTAVSLFAGVGGFDLALERSGVKVVASVEIDKQASGVLAHRFPDATRFTDVTEVTGNELRAAGFIPEHGIITGGFPCQDLSVAGKRAGLAGGRSGLFWEIIRLADELKPKYLILENVPGLLSSNGGRDMGTVLGALAGLGYGVGYRVLDAQFFGVPQRRRRVFIVGRLGDSGRAPAEILAIGEGVRGHLAKGNQARTQTTGTARSGTPLGDGPVAGALTKNMAGAGGGVDDNTAQANHLVVTERERERGDRDNQPDIRLQELQQPSGSDAGKSRCYGQTGFARYTEDQVKTLSATDYKRAEDNLVVRQEPTSSER